MPESPDDESDDEAYPDLPPEQVRRLACLDRALDRAPETYSPQVLNQILAEARAFDAFVANG